MQIDRDQYSIVVILAAAASLIAMGGCTAKKPADTVPTTLPQTGTAVPVQVMRATPIPGTPP